MASIEYLPSQDRAARPGSIEAIESGCTCEVERNNFGLGRSPGTNSASFLIDDACPIHGQKDDAASWIAGTRSFERAALPPERGPRSVIQAWPEQMPAEIAAAYCGEKSVTAFRRAAGKIYPEGRRIPGKGLRWLRSDLETAIRRLHEHAPETQSA